MRVAVLGAGIGGLSTAAALLARGFEVAVYEQASELREVGVGLHLGSNGSRILHRLGLENRLREVAVQPTALEIRGFGDGTVYQRQPMGGSWTAEYGAPYYTVHRADLLHLLKELVPDEHIHLGHRCTGFTEEPDGVRLTFADGSEAEADLLVGADGVHSVVRRAIAGAEEPVFTGTAALRGVVPFDELLDLPTDTMFVWVGAEARLLCYPVAAGRLLTFVVVVPDPRPSPESWSMPGDVDEIVQALTGWEPAVGSIVGAIKTAGRWALYDREPLNRWSTSRVTLLGDAAHPMLPHHGQGANQAIEDGTALAICLADAPSGPDRIEVGLRRYELVRRSHTTRVQLGSRGSGTMKLGRSEGGGSVSSMVEDVSWIQRHDVERTLANS